MEGVPISDLCDELGLQPTVFYRWQKEFFENGTAAPASRRAYAVAPSGTATCIISTPVSFGTIPARRPGEPGRWVEHDLMPRIELLRCSCLEHFRLLDSTAYRAWGNPRRRHNARCLFRKLHGRPKRGSQNTCRPRVFARTTYTRFAPICPSLWRRPSFATAC